MFGGHDGRWLMGCCGLENDAKAPKAVKTEAKRPFWTKAALFRGPFDVSNVAFDVSNAAFEVSNAALEVSNVALEVSNAALEVSNAALEVSNATLEVSNVALGVSNAAFEVSDAVFGIFPAPDNPPPKPAPNAAKATAFMPALSHPLFPENRTSPGDTKRKGTAGAFCAENHQPGGTTLIGGDEK